MITERFAINRITETIAPILYEWNQQGCPTDCVVPIDILVQIENTIEELEAYDEGIDKDT